MGKTEEGQTSKSEVEELLLSDQVADWQLGLFAFGGILTVLMAVWSSKDLSIREFGSLSNNLGLAPAILEAASLEGRAQ